MPQIIIEPYDKDRHLNPMQWVDDTQRERHERAPNLIPYFVCLVSVKGFTFIFHSVEQIRICVDYYQRKIRASSCLPFNSQNLGGDHWECQRWFERLPQHLLEERARRTVVATLEQAISQYSEYPGATTGIDVKYYIDTW